MLPAVEPLLLPKLDHVTGAVSGDCSPREGATISASLGGPAPPRTTQRETGDGEARPRGLARGPSESARPARRLPGPAVGLDEGVSAEGQTAHLGQPDADLGTYWDMAAFRPDSVKHKMSA
jgi:hypothetical protein